VGLIEGKRVVLRDDIQEEFFAVGIFGAEPVVLGGDLDRSYEIGLEKEEGRLADKGFVDTDP